MEEKDNKPFVLLIIECTESFNWYEIFKGAKVLNRPIQVEQAAINDLSATAYSNSKVIVSAIRAKRPHKNTSQERNRTFTPEFVLNRSVCTGIQERDSSSIIYALNLCNVPSTNSFHSMYMAIQKPMVYAGLNSIMKKLGPEKFPLIPVTFYPSFSDMIISPDFPCVVKIGPCHAGYGKILCHDRSQFDDVKSIVALHKDYCTAEQFIDWDYDLRIQKIGNNYRAYKRVSPNWKGNMGNAALIEQVEVTEKYKLWVDECSKLFGGLDICALDAVHCKKTGKEYILELNDTAIGLAHTCEDEDMVHMKNLVLRKITQLLQKPTKEMLEKKEEQSKLEGKLNEAENLLTKEIEEKNKLKAENERLKAEITKLKNRGLLDYISK